VLSRQIAYLECFVHERIDIDLIVGWQPLRLIYL
jgi:hypothetical protein